MRKVINIKRAKRDRNKPFLSMSRKEMKEAFHDLGGDLDEGILEEARTTDVQVRLVCAVLSRDGSEDKFVCSYEEYGDQEYVSLCDDVVSEATPLLHNGERLRVATFDVDPSKLEAFELLSKKVWTNRERDDEAAISMWRMYARLHETRGLVTVAIVWLVGPDATRRLVSWNVDHGDGCGMYEHAIEMIAGMRWNKLLAKGERLEAIAYKVPPAALREVRS